MADRDLTQAQLEELVVGKKENPRAVFFEKAKLNVEKSKEAGRRCYDKLTYVKKTAPGLTDYASALATPKDIMDYPEEYEYFMQNKQGTREPGIEMIPGLDILHLTELRDYGLLTIRKLAEANSVPVHLKAAQDAAIRIQATLAKVN